MTTPNTPTGLFSEIPSFFATASSAATQDLMSLQLSSSIDVGSGTITASDPIVPDKRTSDRLGHMDPEIYDLRDTSHLMKLLKVLLGAPGAGGLRKMMAVARLQNSFNGMHFLDLDRFYGALFGIVRTQTELLPDFSFNPYSDATSSAQWDDIHSRDASYRERLIKFAKAIPYGGSFIGIKTMAEALCGSECDVYESWDWIDEQDQGGVTNSSLVYSWNFLTSTIGTFSAMEKNGWSDWGGGSHLFVGRASGRNRGEFVIHPKTPLSIDQQYELVRVISRFKPAGTSFTVDNSGLNIHIPLQIRGVAASSEYWEITPEYEANPNLSFNPYAKSRTFLTPKDVIPQRRPAFSQYQGEEWSYNSDIVSASSYTVDGTQVTSASDDELVVYADGTAHSYQASDGLMTAGHAHSARIVSDGVMTAAPYAPVRSSINTATVVTP